MSNINLFPELDNEHELEPQYNNGYKDNKVEELIVFGYSCKLFRDDFSAKAIDRGQSLIPWNGDEHVMIDRYDCRGHLSDLTLWDSDILRKKQSNNEEYLNEEEKRIEEECDHERYMELYRDMEKEALNQEEELKRLHASTGAYSQVGFNYEDSNDSKESSNKIAEEVPQPLDDDEYEPFYPPEKLQIPYGMDIPESIKLNAVIEKTASFVSTSGLQMEIVLKTKQANNPQFDFLKYDHYLNPYYRHLIIMIKSGKYRPNFDNASTNTNQKKKSSKNGTDQNSSHDEDDAGDSYLHPLLRGGASNDNTNAAKKSDETARKPSVPVNIHNTAYGLLIKKYEHLRQREKVLIENEEEKMSPKPEEIKYEDFSPKSDSSSSTHVIPPPPDVKPIIDKLAEYVARNGSAFEESIRTKNDPRFGFLDRDHIHHNYYQLKVQLCSQEILRKKTEEAQPSESNEEEQNVHRKGVKLVLKTNTEESLTPTCQDFNSEDDSYSIYQNETEDNNEFIGPRPPSPEFLEKMRKQEQRRDRISGFVRDKIARDKQEERKRKAEMLVQQLKNKTNDSSSVTNSTESTSNYTVNPILVEKLLNVKAERPTSSTAMKSPHQHRRSKHSRSLSKSRSRSKYHRRSRSKSNHRRHRKSSRKRSRTRSKSRNRPRSKRSKNSKSTKHSRSHRRHHHRRHRQSSASTSSSHSSTASRSSSSSSSSTTSSSSSHDRRKKKKITNNNDDEQRNNQRKDNSQVSKWDQREPTKIKSETSSIETVTAASSLSNNTETTLSNSTS